MPSLTMAERMATFEANIRNNEKLGFDSTPLAFARRPKVQAFVSPGTNDIRSMVDDTLHAKRRHTVTGVPKRTVKPTHTDGLPDFLPFDRESRQDLGERGASTAVVTLTSSKSVPKDGCRSAAHHLNEINGNRSDFDLKDTESCSVPVPAKCRFFYHKSEADPPQPPGGTKTRSPRCKSLPAYALSSKISPARPEEQAELLKQLAISSTPATQVESTAIAEVVTYRGMLRMLEQQKRMARRATYFGGITKVPKDMHGLNQVNNHIAPLPAFASPSKSFSSDANSDDTKPSSGILAPPDNILESSQGTAAVDRESRHTPIGHTAKESGSSSQVEQKTFEVKVISSNSNMADHSETSATAMSSSSLFDFQASMSSIDHFDCGGAYFEDYRDGTELHPSYEQQRRMSMARERARRRQEQGFDCTKPKTGVSIKDRMAAFQKMS